MNFLLIDVGNTSINLGVSSEKGLIYSTKITPENFQSALNAVIKKYKPQKSIICSVVPRLTFRLKKTINKFKIDCYLCGKDINIPVANLYKKPEEVGQDRLINVYAVNNLYRNVRLVVDLGTALTFDFISKRGGYLGGLIFPGVSLSLSVLLDKCALLPKKLSLKDSVKSIKGKTTSECINSGIIFGYSFLINGLVGYLRNKEGNFGKCCFVKSKVKLHFSAISSVFFKACGKSLKRFFISS